MMMTLYDHVLFCVWRGIDVRIFTAYTTATRPDYISSDQIYPGLYFVAWRIFLHNPEYTTVPCLSMGYALSGVASVYMQVRCRVCSPHPYLDTHPKTLRTSAVPIPTVVHVPIWQWHVIDYRLPFIHNVPSRPRYKIAYCQCRIKPLEALVHSEKIRPPKIQLGVLGERCERKNRNSKSNSNLVYYSLNI